MNELVEFINLLMLVGLILLLLGFCSMLYERDMIPAI